LPVTTLRTIDLGGKKISGPLFSGFWAESRDFFEGKAAPKTGQLEAQLTAVAVPDRAWRLEVQAFAPYGLGPALIVDADSEVVAEGKAKALRMDVVIARHVAGNPGLGGPGRAAVRGTAVIRIP